MTRYDAWCSYQPYLDHLAPIWSALPDELRGEVYVAPEVYDHADSLGLSPLLQEVHVERGHNTIIFSRAEYRHKMLGNVVFVEHGVGPSYAGKSHLLYAVAAIPPLLGVLTTPANAPAHRALLGDNYVHEVGCPKLDSWHGYTHKRDRRYKPTVAFSHHWDERAFPESRSAWPWDEAAWEAMAASGRYHLLGHKHPGDKRGIEAWCATRGIPFTHSFDDVMTQADIYVCDNSSTLYEFAATDRPVVVLSPPFYRREVDHGLRFWNAVPGVECALAEHLEACIDEALADVPSRARLRRAAVEAAYGPQDGRATHRAVEALEWIVAADVLPWRQANQVSVDTLKYPVSIARDKKPFTFNGRRWKPGDLIDRETAVAMKAAGHLTDQRIA